MSSEADNGSKHIRLSDLTNGEKGVVCNLQGEANVCSRLREMGFCEEAVVEKLSGNHTMLCQVCGTRIALNGQIAKNILVQKLQS